MQETNAQGPAEDWIQFLLQDQRPVAQMYENLFRAAFDLTGLPLVQVTRIRHETHLRLEALVDQLGLGYKGGDEFPLEEMLESEVIRKRDSIVIPNLASTAYIRNPAAAKHGIRCFIGTPLILQNQQLYGVLSMMDRQPHPLGKDALLRLSLLGKWLARDIELRQTSRDLAAKNNRLAVVSQEMQRLQNQLEQGTIRDPITDLLNSRYFNKVLQKESSRARRHAYPLSLLLLYPDGISSLRRQWGLDTTHAVLSAVGVLLRRYLRNIDNAARYTEEIFAILLPQTDHTGASIVAERIRSTISTHAFRGSSPRVPSLSLTASIGIAALNPVEEDPVLGILSRARRALEQARHAGGDRVIVAPASS